MSATDTAVSENPIAQSHTKERFWLGHENVLEPVHIGRTILIDHYDQDVSGSPRRLNMHTHVGVLAGFAEDRGVGRYEASELGFQGDGGGMEYPDISVHTEYAVRIILQDGRTVRVKDGDYAEIWFPAGS